MLATKVRKPTGTKGRAKEVQLGHQPETVLANLSAVDIISCYQSCMHADWKIVR